MAVLTWDDTGERFYETGVSNGVLYIPTAGVYDNGVAWNGLVSVTETPSGAEANPQYADNEKYLNLYSKEEFGCTIEAFTYPDEFAVFDGSASPVAGMTVGQQSRGTFGLSYMTRIGNDVDGDTHGYKLHLVYGCTASPSEKAYTTINDSPEAITFSWEVMTIPVPLDGYQNTSLITVDSRVVAQTEWDALVAKLWGDLAEDPSLPTPAEVVTILTP